MSAMSPAGPLGASPRPASTRAAAAPRRQARSQGGSAQLFDEPGPRGRLLIRVATAVSLVAIAAVAAWAVWTFGRNDQLAADRWHEFTTWPTWRYLLKGFWGTLRGALGAAAIALPLGVVLALGRLSRRRLLRWPSIAVIEFFRAMPLLLLVYIFFFALPRYGITPALYWQLIIPIGLCSGATIAEVFRAGILALPAGQTEAAEAVGLTHGQTMRFVVVPQAVRLVLPGLLAQVVVLLKDTTLGYVVSYSELQFSAKVLVNSTGHLVQTYLLVTVLYILINLAISQAADAWGRRSRRAYARAGAAPTTTTGIA